MRGTKTVLALLFIMMIMLLTACGTDGSAVTLSDAEQTAAAQLLPDNAGALSDVTADALSGREDKFPGVLKVLTAENGDYIFVSYGVGYAGPITVVLAINNATQTSYGLRIVEEYESSEYVRDYATEDWFAARFADKSAAAYLHSVEFNATADDEIVAITGSTQTTDAVILAVNAAFGVYQEYVQGQTAVAVADATNHNDYDHRQRHAAP